MSLWVPMGIPWMWCITSDCDSLSSKKETKKVSIEHPPSPYNLEGAPPLPVSPPPQGRGKTQVCSTHKPSRVLVSRDDAMSVFIPCDKSWIVNC